MDIWTVYDHPSDFPDLWVARRFTLDQPTRDVRTSVTLDGLRALLPPGLVCIARHPQDDPRIVECWI
jgi:hypothetical protein